MHVFIYVCMYLCMYGCIHVCIWNLYTIKGISKFYPHGINNICWFVWRGRIKEKISTICGIKDQVYCMENTVQWLVNTVQLF